MENLQKEFVPYELALKMKQLGFNESCFAFYNGKHLDLGIWDWEYPAGQKRRDIGECPQAPLFQQAFRWFRDKYGLCSWIERMYTADSICYYRYTCEYKKDPLSKTHEVIVSLKEYDNYEEAELACLKKLFEIVEQNGKDKSET